MRLRRQLLRALRLMDHSVAVVVFTVPERRLREMEVATGPCVPTGGRTRPLAGVTRQDGGELPEHTASLYTALTGRPADGALVLLAQQGQGRLSVASPPFVDAMAEAHARLEALREADLTRDDAAAGTWWAEWQALGQAWCAAAAWPRGVTSTAHRLDRLYWAHAARERGQRLYVWHGPRAPEYEVVAAGTGSG